VSPEGKQQQLEIHLFGGLEIGLNSAPLSGNVTSKAKGLLAFLAVEADRSHRREFLAEMFWPERPQGTARNNLRQALLTLRASLGENDSNRPFLLPTADEIQFNIESQFYLDTLEFDRLIQASLNHDHQRLQACTACEDRLQRAVRCYQDDFLIDAALPDAPEFDSWAVSRREGYRRDLFMALRALISMYEDRNEYQEGSGLARKLVELEPWDEANHRILMRTLALAGRRSAALKQYQTCKRVLAVEFHVEPSSETTELYDAIRYGRMAILREESAPRLAVDAPDGLHSDSFSEGDRGLSRFRPWYWAIALAILSAGALILFGASLLRNADLSDGGGDASEAGTPPGVLIVASVVGDWFWVVNFLPGETLSMSIYESDARSNEMWHETMTADDRGFANVESWVHGVDLMPGNMIVVSDERVERTLILELVTMDVFDVDADFMAGTAPADRVVHVVAGFGPDAAEQHSVSVTSDARTGEWMIDFASIGIDIKEDWRPWSFAQIFDEDGDANESNPPPH
jgi:DNA-binding SARP family transcriptional activator